TAFQPEPVRSVKRIIEDETETGLINAFGMFWRRNDVFWTSRPNLYGTQQSGSEPIDFAQQAGLYLLYDSSRVIYVGRVIEPRMGGRLREHTRDRLQGRWDAFSWFGVRPVDSNGNLGQIPNSPIDVATLITTMEALMIEGLEPPQNRRQGDKFSAVEFIQAPDPEIERQQHAVVLTQALTGLRSSQQ